MKAIKFEPKTIRFLLLLFVAMLLPSMSMAKSKKSEGGMFGEEPVPYYINYGFRGGLFGSVSYGYYNIYTQQFGSDDYGGFNISTQLFGEEEEESLSSGWVVLTLAGTAYAIKKRKNNNKK